MFASEKTLRKKVFSYGIMVGVFIAGVVLGDALDKFFARKEIQIVNWKGHTFSIGLNSGFEGTRLIPGDEKTLSLTINNKSTTDNAYVFIEFEYNQDAYEIENGSDWEKIYEDSGDIIYSYSSGGTMTLLDIGGDPAVFNGTLKVKAEGSLFQSLSSDDMVVTVKAHGISTEVCSSGNNFEAWSDYEDQSNSNG